MAGFEKDFISTQKLKKDGKIVSQTKIYFHFWMRLILREASQGIWIANLLYYFFKGISLYLSVQIQSARHHAWFVCALPMLMSVGKSSSTNDMCRVSGECEQCCVCKDWNIQWTSSCNQEPHKRMVALLLLKAIKLSFY